MKKGIIILTTLFLFLSCTSEEVNPILDGTYKGTFKRDNFTTQVVVFFENDTFSGESNTKNFPAIYFGNFQTYKGDAYFENKQLFHTTEFLPNLILNGKWDLTLNGKKIILKNNIGDVYELEKE